MNAADQSPAQRTAPFTRTMVRCGLLIALALSVAGCDKCGRATPINKPWSMLWSTTACEAGPTTR